MVKADSKNDSGKGIALAVLGIVAVLAIVGLVLLFTQAKADGMVARSSSYWDRNYGSLTNVADFKYGPESMTGGPYCERNRCSRGTEAGGPRWRIEAGADVIGQYVPSQRFARSVPGGNPYMEAYG